MQMVHVCLRESDELQDSVVHSMLVVLLRYVQKWVEPVCDAKRVAEMLPELLVLAKAKDFGTLVATRKKDLRMAKQMEDKLDADMQQFVPTEDSMKEL